ncbi:MAG TPA: L-threonylcarbamoyladenylate synthase [Legionellaceae bacterium]|nr:L-threonylcarbamoyladenylate synthase [Legionellaceae bacterium]
MIKRLKPADAGLAIQNGQVIAYPTEAVFGLGCDPFHHMAVKRILQLKQRPWQKGLIVWIANWSQLSRLVQEIPQSRMEIIQASWPGPITWVFPKSSIVPEWVSGTHDSIAIRMSAHPLAQQLCQYGPIISTSANPQGQAPARSLEALESFFPEGLDGVVAGTVDIEAQPSAIYDAMSNERLR